MPRYCANGFLMSLTARYPIIKLAGVPMREEASLKADCVGCLHIGPLEITVHIVPHLPIAPLAAARVHPWGRAEDRMQRGLKETCLRCRYKLELEVILRNRIESGDKR